MAKKIKRKAGKSEPGVDASLARNGGLSYLEIPAVNPRKSAEFYGKVFGWKLEEADTDHPKFMDQSGHLLGRWVTGRAASRKPGLLPYIYVDQIKRVMERVAAHGGQIVRAPYAECNLWVSVIRDPAGNVIGVWQAR
jgi:uncharacterized protein